MTKGIDLASPQNGITVQALHDADIDWAIVKAGGFNVKPIYVAPHYHEEIDTVIKAGLPKGHYWVIGAGDVLAQAKFFVDNLYQFDKDHDVLVLDNERLNSNATFLTDDQIATFATYVIQATGIKPHRFWLYQSAYDTRSQNYPKTNALGIRLWVASYGKDDGSRVEPDLGGKFPKYDVHQYTSNGKVGGYIVDLDFSPLGVDVLFKDPYVEPKIERLSFIKLPDGSIYLADPASKTKTHILKNQWPLVKQVGIPVLSISATTADLYRSL